MAYGYAIDGGKKYKRDVLGLNSYDLIKDAEKTRFSGILTF